jgi:hypothetical protein
MEEKNGRRERKRGRMEGTEEERKEGRKGGRKGGRKKGRKEGIFINMFGSRKSWDTDLLICVSQDLEQYQAQVEASEFIIVMIQSFPILLFH